MENIKISELSVGDWVRYDRGTDAVQIMGIYVRNNQECVVMSDSYFPDGVIGFVECIKPIPLTPEILEKNGFSHNGQKWYTPELFTLERWSKGWTIVIACSCGDYVCEVCTIKYVHQLQHALRLAGVGKEVVL